MPKRVGKQRRAELKELEKQAQARRQRFEKLLAEETEAMAAEGLDPSDWRARFQFRARKCGLPDPYAVIEKPPEKGDDVQQPNDFAAAINAAMEEHK